MQVWKLKCNCALIHSKYKFIDEKLIKSKWTTAVTISDNIAEVAFVQDVLQIKTKC